MAVKPMTLVEFNADAVKTATRAREKAEVRTTLVGAQRASRDASAAIGDLEPDGVALITRRLRRAVAHIFDI